MVTFWKWDFLGLPKELWKQNLRIQDSRESVSQPQPMATSREEELLSVDQTTEDLTRFLFDEYFYLVCSWAHSPSTAEIQQLLSDNAG